MMRDTKGRKKGKTKKYSRAGTYRTRAG